MHLDVPIIGILRGIDRDFFPAVMAASFGAGLQALEITMNTPGGVDLVARCRPEVPPGKLLGMGTVRNPEEARQALAAGAMFLVTPNTDPKVIELASSQGIPVIAGAFTPTELYAAWSAGAAMVKVFPCGAVGADYLRELRGPFEQIPLVAVGGVNRHNLTAYFGAGARGVGVGSALFGAEALAGRNPVAVAEHVRDFIAVWHRWRQENG